MNARLYDPEIGRFISADTCIDHPLNMQTFNRYSYVMNNPLKYIDPTGYQDANTPDSPLPVEHNPNPSGGGGSGGGNGNGGGGGTPTSGDVKGLINAVGDYASNAVREVSGWGRAIGRLFGGGKKAPPPPPPPSAAGGYSSQQALNLSIISSAYAGDMGSGSPVSAGNGNPNADATQTRAYQRLNGIPISDAEEAMVQQHPLSTIYRCISHEP